MSNSATEYVVHGWRSYMDYDKSRGNRRQLLVSDQVATFLTNFLAVFLAIAAKSFYNIVRRILRLRTLRRKSGEQDSNASKQSITGMNAPLAITTTYAPNTPAIATPATALTVTSRGSRVAQVAAAPAAAGDQATDAEGSNQVQLERLEMIDAAPDPPDSKHQHPWPISFSA